MSKLNYKMTIDISANDVLEIVKEHMEKEGYDVESVSSKASSGYDRFDRPTGPVFNGVTLKMKAKAND